MTNWSSTSQLSFKSSRRCNSPETSLFASTDHVLHLSSSPFLRQSSMFRCRLQGHHYAHTHPPTRLSISRRFCRRSSFGEMTGWQTNKQVGRIRQLTGLRYLEQIRKLCRIGDWKIRVFLGRRPNRGNYFLARRCVWGCGRCHWSPWFREAVVVIHWYRAVCLLFNQLRRRKDELRSARIY